MTAYTAEVAEDLSQLALLVRAAQAGDREAFGALVECYETTVYGIALRRLRNHAEAQELTQEVFVQVLRKIGQLREPDAFPGWLRSIAQRMAINRAVRGGSAVSTDPSMLEASCAEPETPVCRALERERAAQVRAGLSRLGRMDRETLEAFYVEGQSLAEMSNAFASPVGTIKRRLHVARKRLARELESMAV